MLRGAPEGQATAVARALSAASVLCQVEPNQDHYSVLGLGRLRYKASQKQIKAAHKAMVLKHHPDKRKAAGEQIGEAYETLSDPTKRRAFNSIDPTFDNAVPSKSEAKENFFEVFAPVFERNARYNFDSWREFSYLDEEEKEKAECRDERRWIEKQNRAGRSLRKKEEMNRIRTLVGRENPAFSDLILQRQAELEMARLAREKEEEETRQQTLLMKKEKDMQKKAIKKERQKLRTTCKNWNYFSDNEAESVKMMEEVEKLCDRLELASMQCLNEALTSTTKDEGKAAVLKQIEQVNEQVRREKEEAEAQMRQATKSSDKWEVIANYMNLHSATGIRRTAKDVINKAKNLQKLVSFTDASPWTTEEQKLLEQALKTYPVNTPERWEKIAASVPGRSKKDCMKRYKELVEMVKAKKAAQEQVVNAAKTKK
ncbi:hypothetical protein Chor_002511 [Crotalus horridus]